MRWLTCTLLAALLAVSAVPVAARAANPFCKADFTAVAWDAARNAPAEGPANDAVRLQLYGRATRSFGAHVLLATDTQLFEATIAPTPILGRDALSPLDRASAPVLVRIGAPSPVRYAWLDTVSIDDAAPSPCATIVAETLVPTPSTASDLLTPPTATATAAYYHAMPPLRCPKAITPVQVRSIAVAPSTRKGGAVAVWVDGKGRAGSASLTRSTGDAASDAALLDAVRGAAYEPATFWCVPVVAPFSYRW